MRMASWATLFLALSFTGMGCSPQVKPPGSVKIDPLKLTPQEAEQAWSRVLQNDVDWRGRVDFQKIAEKPDDLYFFIAYIGKNSPKNQPEIFPTKESQLAFYINSYNALLIYGIILEGYPRDFGGFFSRKKFFDHLKFIVGGESLSLQDYEDQRIRPLGDPRIHFALTYLTESSPLLPREPYRAEALDEQLDRAARKFVNNPANVQTFEKAGIVRLSEIFKFYEEDFVNPKTASSVIEYVNRYLDHKIPPSFNIEYLPFDWKIRYQ